MQRRRPDHRRAPGWLACAGAFWLATAATLAQTADPLQAPACLAARQQLSVQEERMAAERAARPAALPASRAALEAARRRVGVVCLRAPDAPPQVLRPAHAAASSPAVTSRPPRPPATAAAPPATPRVPPLLSVTSCDANGCWASDGSRLTRVGPNLLGPRGYCTTAGNILNCP